MSAGVDIALKETITAVPSFTPMLLLFVFMVVTLGGSLSQKRRVGSTDLPMWVSLGALSTLMVALPMTVLAGFINLETLIIVVVLTIASIVLAIADRM